MSYGIKTNINGGGKIVVNICVKKRDVNTSSWRKVNMRCPVYAFFVNIDVHSNV